MTPKCPFLAPDVQNGVTRQRIAGDTGKMDRPRNGMHQYTALIVLCGHGTEKTIEIALKTNT